MIDLSQPFISSKKSICSSEQFDYSRDFADFLISELDFLVSQKGEHEGFLALAEAILMLTHDHPEFLKKIVFYGIVYGMGHKDFRIFTDVLVYIDMLFRKWGISASDRLSLCSARACIHFEMFVLSGDLNFIARVLDDNHLIEQLLQMHPQLENRLGWEHFRLGKSLEEVSSIASANVYHAIGKSFIVSHQKHLELEDLTRGLRNLSRAVDLSPNNLPMRADYAEALIRFGVREGRSLYVEQGMEQLSRVIFLSFGRSGAETDQENYRFRYAIAAVQLFDVSYKKEHFQQATRILYQTIQAFPNLICLWAEWGELLIRFGWINNNMRLVESGLEKLASVQKKSKDPISLSGSLAAGISILGLYLEEPGLFRESRQRLISVMKTFPGNHSLVYALGVIQLCSALYFNDDANFASAISCFQSCIEWDYNTIEVLQKLFDAYFSWGVKKKSVKLLHKAIGVSRRLCALRPEVFLFWNDRGLALRCLAEASSDEVYKEVFLLESLLHYEKAWSLSFRVEVLELWGHSYYLLGELQDNLSYYDEALCLLSRIDPSVVSFRAKLLLAATLLGKGSLSQEEGFFKEAEAILEPLRQVYPEDENILLLSGKVYLFLYWKQRALEQRKRAKFYLEQAVSLGCPEAYYTLGKLYAVEQDVEKAWKMIMRSIYHGVKITEAQWLKDPYLANLRATHTFREILANQRGGLWSGSQTEAKRN